ncbi:transcription factor TFIIIB component B'' homolog isoform X2 [Triplophysa dalaica]|uniref:transcription factor TFIIIB component B'' homolog isoform X2 n=1 Tax=Triplophysa dalaica TaxID=1582913 RepID=UPI0024DFB178|nr:transcription factor TFIIIB component B'' homolog isoform X2 [Triplophysa dalaica]
MRRARISIKPNVKPGGRAVAPTAESTTSQESAAVDNTPQKHTGEKTDTPSASQQSHLEVKGPAVATGDGNVPGCPSEKASVNTGDGVPSSAITPAATALQRRSRISATPNLARPKVRSVPPASTEKNASLPSVPSKSSPEPPVPSATSRDDSQNSTLSDSILKQTNATINSTPSSPCHEPSVQNTSTSSTQLQQELFRTPKKSCSGPKEAVSPSSSITSPCIKLSRCYGPGPPLSNSEMSDKQRVLKALKLKELMKLERRRELMKRKSGRRMCEHSDEVDLGKMTLADFIYYLPETNPMTSSFSTEEAPAETVVRPSPKVPPKLVEPEKEENDDDDDEDDDLMVPKVRVAEDGTLILDEDSLTVRVQRTSDTVVEDATPLFERGNTTTYMSFRKNYHVKIWSVRETDMFYLAISMVGTDFSMMAQLLTHRNRAEIKNKFKKEEKTNAWRVDKALQNKRPFDNEFFSFLLKRVLEKDKKRGKSIKLVVKPNKANKGKGGKKGKKHEDQEIGDDIQDEVDFGDNDSLDLEKENEDHNNVKVSDVTSSKKRKRKRESGPKGSPAEKTCKRKKNKTKSKKGEESNCLQVEDDSVNAENEDPSLMPLSKKKRKRSRKVSDEQSLDIDGENSQASIELKPTDTSKTCKRSKKCKEETAKGKRKTRKSKKSSEECTGDELNDVSSEVSTAGPDAEEDKGDKPTPDIASQEETPEHTSKRSKMPLPKIPKRKAKKGSVSFAPLEDEDAAPEGQDANCRKADSEFQVDSLVDSQLQKQAVVVLERVPPSPDQSQTAESLQGTPDRQTRVEMAKQNLIGSEREKNEIGKMDNCQTASGSDTSAKNMTMTTLACQDDNQESKTIEEDQHMKGDLSMQTEVSTEVNDQVLLKRPVVMLSHEEVHHYLEVHTKTEENSSASESHLDAVSAKVKSVEEHMDCHVEKSASGVALEEKVSQYPGLKESASTSPQQCIAQKRRRFAKPTPNLSRSQQTEEKPLILQTTEYIDDNPDSLRSCPVEDATTPLNKCPASPEEHPTSSETLKEDFQDLRVNESKQDGIETTIDDVLSFSSDEENPLVEHECCPGDFVLPGETKSSHHIVR